MDSDENKNGTETGFKALRGKFSAGARKALDALNDPEAGKRLADIAAQKGAEALIAVKAAAHSKPVKALQHDMETAGIKAAAALEGVIASEPIQKIQREAAQVASKAAAAVDSIATSEPVRKIHRNLEAAARDAGDALSPAAEAAGKAIGRFFGCVKAAIDSSSKPNQPDAKPPTDPKAPGPKG